MDQSEYDPLLARFGSRPYYDIVFSGRRFYDARHTFQMLEISKYRSELDYNAARQQFLHILGTQKDCWRPTGPETDRDVEVLKLFREEKREYLAFMRIFTGGYRGERSVPSHMKMIFHLLLGRVAFTYNKRTKIMNRGSHITVAPKSNFSIRCLNNDQTAYFVFQIKVLGKSRPM